MKTNEKIPELLTMKETCELLKVHANTLRQWDKKGILKAVRFGARRDRRYKKEDVIALLNQK
jgi:excisionase family DNA binding protein